VTQLTVSTIGGVVQPAETLMVIVPSDAPLEIEATLQNKDAGFVRPGQRAEIKLEAFPYTIYGTLTDEVVGISADAVSSLPAQSVSTRLTGSGTAEDTTRPSVYTAQVRLDHATIEADGQTLVLGPGLSASVEIRTGRRTVLTYVLAPIIRYRTEALREK
jgi:hemolysin D